MDNVTRRRAVSLTAASAAAAIVAGNVRAKEEGAKEGQYYKGVSKKGNIQEALDNAVKNALDAAPGADRQVKWTIKEVSGVKGGILPLNTLTVEIEATVT